MNARLAICCIATCVFLFSCSEKKAAPAKPLFVKVSEGTGPMPDSLRQQDSTVVHLYGKKFTVYSSSCCTRKNK